MATTGTATIDFGSTPAAESSVTVTGQAAILATSQVEAWVMGATTASNDANAHMLAATSMRIFCGAPTAGQGFTITAINTMGLATGQFKIQWVWN